MARLARAEVFVPTEVATVHVMNRVVRRCFLFGDDPVSGKNFDHRKVWIETLLIRLAASFGIDLLGFSILSNHFHLILRSRPDVVAEWSDTEAARRWLMVCPLRRDDDDQPCEPTDMDLNTIRCHPGKLEKIRLRLSDISWWMRILCQRIAQRANQEDGEKGRFFQTRFQAVRLLDEQALLACAAYVDLNPIRARIARTLEDSDFTSVQRRIEAVKAEHQLPRDNTSPTITTVSGSVSVKKSPAALDQFLSPVAIDERNGPLGPVVSASSFRASDKGFLPISREAYLQLLDWTARNLAPGKRGRSPESLAPLFTRLGLDEDAWCGLVAEFGKLFYNVAGQPQTIDHSASRITQRRYHMSSQARKLFANSGKT